MDSIHNFVTLIYFLYSIYAKLFLFSQLLYLYYHYHFFFFFFFAPAYFYIFIISFCLLNSCFCRNYCHYWSNCYFFVFMFNSIASLLSFLVCLFNKSTPDMSYSLLIRFLSINYMYLSSSCYCLFFTSWSCMAITSSKAISGLFYISILCY